MTRRGFLPAAVVLFAILATANSGGYRYGASDQAFYAPAIAQEIDPALFPRDAELLATQTRLWAGDEAIAVLARLTTSDLPLLFAALYAATMILLATGGAAVMRALGASTWATASFLILLSLRHQITKTGANTLEGYMHPRMLAFAVGLFMLAALLRRRTVAALVALAAAAALHTTTALWFAVVFSGAQAVQAWQAAGMRAVRGIGAGVLALAAAAAWALAAGPLSDGPVVIDEAWLSVIEGRDYLFPSTWPAYAWLANLGYPLIVWLVFRRRRALGVTASGENGVVIGLLALAIVFLISVPLSAMRVALAVQLQVNRVFWLLDVAAAAYLSWWLIDSIGARAGAVLRPLAAGLLLACSVARGAYVLAAGVQRPLFELRPQGAWMEAMDWLRAQPADWHVLADPQHAWKYGVSVRAAALRDTVLELSKDTSIAMYDRRIARRVAERMQALYGFEEFAESAMRALDARYDLDVLVLETSPALALPVLYRNGRFVIYDLR